MKTKLTLLKGDITKLHVDAIVNAANTSLLGGGGVDGAIHRAGGSQILKECIEIRNAQGGCPTGEAVITNAGNLPAKKVIHTVGPVWRGGSDEERVLLSNCYFNSLDLAKKHELRSLAFPNISTGVFGFPKEEAAEIAVATTQRFIADEPDVFDEIIFICFDDENYKLYDNLLFSEPK
ncbi:MAG TPA: O-acetyl-ADP-ribose deacetylase [Segetibacter sp.]|jgi:O-acetyl-ADP-ribose deacetylase (regulator of RNase III)